MTDTAWERIEPLLPQLEGRGRLSADQLGRMQRSIDERTANGTMDWSKMKDPDSAKAYLGIE